MNYSKALGITSPVPVAIPAKAPGASSEAISPVAQPPVVAKTLVAAAVPVQPIQINRPPKNRPVLNAEVPFFTPAMNPYSNYQPQQPYYSPYQETSFYGQQAQKEPSQPKFVLPSRPKTGLIIKDPVTKEVKSLPTAVKTIPTATSSAVESYNMASKWENVNSANGTNISNVDVVASIKPIESKTEPKKIEFSVPISKKIEIVAPVKKIEAVAPVTSKATEGSKKAAEIVTPAALLEVKPSVVVSLTANVLKPKVIELKQAEIISVKAMDSFTKAEGPSKKIDISTATSKVLEVKRLESADIIPKALNIDVVPKVGLKFEFGAKTDSKKDVIREAKSANKKDLKPEVKRPEPAPAKPTFASMAAAKSGAAVLKFSAPKRAVEKKYDVRQESTPAPTPPNIVIENEIVSKSAVRIPVVLKLNKKEVDMFEKSVDAIAEVCVVKAESVSLENDSVPVVVNPIIVAEYIIATKADVVAPAVVENIRLEKVTSVEKALIASYTAVTPVNTSVHVAKTIQAETVAVAKTQIDDIIPFVLAAAKTESASKILESKVQNNEAVIETIETDLTQAAELVDADSHAEDSDDLDKEDLEDYEEGEIAEMRLLKSFDGVKYPTTLKCILPRGTIRKYSLDFMLAFKSLITSRPVGMPSLSEINDESPRQSAFGGSSGKPAYMSRDRGMSASGSSSVRPSHAYERPNDRDMVRGNDRSSKGSRAAPQTRGPKIGRERERDRERDGRDIRRQQAAAPPSFVPHAALHKAEHAWAPTKQSELTTDEQVSKTIKGLLNKLTLENFARLCDKILNAEFRSEAILSIGIDLIFEKAVSESHFASMYARLCQVLMSELPNIQPWIDRIPGKNQFRGLLVKKCQTEFQSAAKWAEQDSGDASSRAAKRINIASLPMADQIALAEEDYVRLVAKRRSLGNTQFVGELFINGMISDNIIHYCITSLLEKGQNPEEEDIESLCKLMTTVGKRVSVIVGSTEHLESYFERIKHFSTHELLPSRIRFMLMDLMDLRANKWVPRAAKGKGPMTIAQVHESAKEDVRKEEREKMQRASNARSVGKSGSVRRSTESRSSIKDSDGWTKAEGTRKVSTPFVREAPPRSSGAGGWGAVKVRENEPLQKENKYTLLQRAAAAETETEIEPEIEAELIPAEEDVVDEATDSLHTLQKAYKNFVDDLDAEMIMNDFAAIKDDSLLPALLGLVFRHLVDSNGKQIDSFVELLMLVIDAHGVHEIWSSLATFFINIEEEKSDFPNRYKNFSQLLVPLYEKQMISAADIVGLATPLLTYSGIKPDAPNFLAAFLSELPVPSQISLLSQPISLASFWPGSKVSTKDFEFWVKMKKLPVVLKASRLSQKVSNSTDELIPLSDDGKPDFKLRLCTVLCEFICSETSDLTDPLKTNDDGKAAYVAALELVEILKPVFTDFTELDFGILLMATEKAWLAHSFAESLEDIFRIYHTLELGSYETFISCRDKYTPSNVKLLNGWHKFLEQVERSNINQ